MIGTGTGRDLMNYANPLDALLYILSSFANDANSQPIFRWHGVYSVTQDRINIHIHFVGYAALAELQNRDAQVEGLSLAITLIFLSIGIFWLLSTIIRRVSIAKKNSEQHVIEVKKDNQDRQACLLCEIDHQAILEACRQLLLQIKGGDLKPGTYKIRREPDPLSKELPQPILDLAPNHIYIDDSINRIKIEMDGELQEYGVFAYPDDFKKPDSDFEYGDKKLIDGLWYYDSGYSNPDYEKKIDLLLQKREI